jgi:serine/threonine protein kinase
LNEEHIMPDRTPPLSAAPLSGAAEPPTAAGTDEPETIPYALEEDVPQPAGVASSAAVPAQLPAQFGRYRLDQLLGKGGMGAVYRAYDTQLDRQVALKVPKFEHDEGVLRDRFLREARAAATLRHPNLCPVFDIGEHDGVWFLTMAYIEGIPLSDYLLAKKPLGAAKAAGLAARLARALQEAHAHGIIHRDLKPGNILLSRDEEPIITDFGLARRSASQDERLTCSGAVLGTPAYMSPEQVNGDVAAMGPGCDIYSLGVILYEMLAGRLPFEGGMGLLMAQIVLEPPPPPSRSRPDLDPALEKICLKALAKMPDDRYSSMQAFAEALEEWRADQADAGTNATRRIKKRTGLWVLVVCSLIFVACVLPIGWLVVMVGQFFSNASERMNQAGQRLRDQQKEQSRLREEWDQEQQQLETAVRAWKAPPADAGSSRLFPILVGDYRLSHNDSKAKVPDLNLDGHVGQRALYESPAGSVDLLFYRTNKLEKEAILQRASRAVMGGDGGFPGLTVAGMPSVLGSPAGAYLSYDLGPKAASEQKYGTFLWSQDWLLLSRGRGPRDAGTFLQKYLSVSHK